MLEVPGIVMNRRRMLQFGAYAAFGSAINQSHALRAALDLPPTPIRSCIFLMHYGGPSHLDTWDMKPGAPAEVRGEYKPIATSVPGRVVCEHLPRMARLVDRVAVVRSMHHPMGNHNAAMYEALVGRHPVGGDKELLAANRSVDFPSVGCAISFLTEQRRLPPAPVPLTHVALPHVLHNVVDLAGQNDGFFGGKYDPLQIVRDPSHPAFRVDELNLPGDVPANRLLDRKELLAVMNADGSRRNAGSLQSYRDRAFELLRSPRVRQAFEIQNEPEPVRDRYGRHELGQSLLLARRLVEAGVRFINVNDRRVNGQDANWDSHQTIFPRHKELIQPADQGFSALIEDLEQRGLLASTLVIAMGEFGRTPKINTNAGRDHWPQCFHVLLAGGGVAGGAAYGSSDRIGAYPDTDPTTPADLAATIFWRFGIDHTQDIHDPLGRPFRLSDGQPVKDLF